MTTDGTTGGVNVARLRARVLWLAAKARFAKGATTARFKRSDLARMLELDLSLPDEADPFGGVDAVVMALPEDGSPTWDGDEFTLTDPDKRRAAPDEAAVIAVLDYWRERTGRTDRTEYTAARMGIVRARLREGYTTDQLRRAVDALVASSFHTEGGFTDTSHAFKTERLERWLSTASRPDPATSEVERVANETLRRRRR